MTALPDVRHRPESSADRMTLRLGIDTGGTFTDLALVDDATDRAWLFKLASTPADPSAAIADGARRVLADAGFSADALDVLAHGTTVATNAVLEGKLARTGMITTEGFRDVLEIARQRRPSLYDLDVAKPAPPVPRPLRREIAERLAPDGSVVTPLNEAEVERVVRELSAAGVEAIAVCLLHAYANAAHEEQVEKVIHRLAPDTPVSRSSAVLPEIREYERFTTTTLNAALRPIVGRYLRRLVGRAREAGVPVAPRIMQSNGGVMSAIAAEERPVRTLFSGPSAGVIGAAIVAGEAGVRDLITLDMGGTSTDVCLVRDGAPAIRRERELAGLPVKAAMVDVHSIGAGGGSIGWIDTGGFLQVGPRSAGALPGPACYARGGVEPTVTDANVLLGRLGADSLLGGRMRLDVAAAERAITDRVAGPLGVSAVEAAVGTLRVVNVNMARAVRVVTVEKGHDARELVLVGFGGAGPMHVADVAAELDVRRVLVPESPGILCALGLLLADVRADFGRTALMPLAGLDVRRVEMVFAGIETEARAWLSREGLEVSRATLDRSIDARYVGQDYELPVSVSSPLTDRALGDLANAFHEAHERAYGYAARDAAIQLVSFRVVARVTVPRRAARARQRGAADVSRAMMSRRSVYFEAMGAFVDCPVYDRARLGPGHRIPGPAIVEQMDATTVIPPRWIATVDAFANLVIEHER
jgi:N-methylhydantoinase A